MSPRACGTGATTASSRSPIRGATAKRSISGRRSASDAPGAAPPFHPTHRSPRSEEHTSELQSLMRISYAVFCLKKKKKKKNITIQDSDISQTNNNYKKYNINKDTTNDYATKYYI